MIRLILVTRVIRTQFEQFDLVNCSCSKSSNQSFVLGFVHPFSGLGGLGGRPPIVTYKVPNPRG